MKNEEYSWITFEKYGFENSSFKAKNQLWPIFEESADVFDVCSSILI